jgi:hypothetical protein
MTSCGGSDDGNACRAPNGGRWACRLIAEERVNAADSSTVLSESARRTTEVVPEGAADKARAGALGGLKANVRSTIRGTSDDQTRTTARRDVVSAGQRADRGPRSASSMSPWSPESPVESPPAPRNRRSGPPPRRCGSKGPSNPAAVPWTPESSAADDQEAMGGEGDGNR